MNLRAILLTIFHPIHTPTTPPAPVSHILPRNVDEALALDREASDQLSRVSRETKETLDPIAAMIDGIHRQ